MKKQLEDKIADLVGEAYEIGHAHGGNAYRMAMGQRPKKVNVGWFPIAEKIISLVQKEL